MLAARMPPAPGMFSTMNGLANLLLNFSASKRANTSGLPPGPEGAISRTVWVGHASSWAIAAGESIASSAVRTADVRCMVMILKRRPKCRVRVVAGPAFGDLVADDMIDMSSFGVNLEPGRRDAVIGSKVRRAQAPARHHLVVLAKHVFDGHAPIGKCDQQLPNESLHGGKTFHRFEPSSKIYEIVGKDIVELVERARVGSVMIAMKQFERLLIVHLPLLQLPQSRFGHGIRPWPRPEAHISSAPLPSASSRLTAEYARSPPPNSTSTAPCPPSAISICSPDGATIARLPSAWPSASSWPPTGRPYYWRAQAFVAFPSRHL